VAKRFIENLPQRGYVRCKLLFTCKHIQKKGKMSCEKTALRK